MKNSTIGAPISSQGEEYEPNFSKSPVLNGHTQGSARFSICFWLKGVVHLDSVGSVYRMSLQRGVKKLHNMVH